MTINELTLLSGVDIPLPSAQVSIHQPTLKEIAYINEETFFIGCELLNYSKESLPTEDKDRLKDYSDFDIIMSIMKDKTNLATIKNATCAFMVLALVFPEYTVNLKDNYISLKKTFLTEEYEKGELKKVSKSKEFKIDSSNYIDFIDILSQMFHFQSSSKEKKYNPKGALAKRIADKFKKAAQKKALEGNPEKIAVLSRYASILAVGAQKDLNEIMNYTVYQLFDEFQRYELKLNYDIYLQAKMAGAKDLEEVDNWMKDLYSPEEEKIKPSNNDSSFVIQ